MKRVLVAAVFRGFDHDLNDGIVVLIQRCEPRRVRKRARMSRCCLIHVISYSLTAQGVRHGVQHCAADDLMLSGGLCEHASILFPGTPRLRRKSRTMRGWPRLALCSFWMPVVSAKRRGRKRRVRCFPLL